MPRSRVMAYSAMAGASQMMKTCPYQLQTFPQHGGASSLCRVLRNTSCCQTSNICPFNGQKTKSITVVVICKCQVLIRLCSFVFIGYSCFLSLKGLFVYFAHPSVRSLTFLLQEFPHHPDVSGQMHDVSVFSPAPFFLYLFTFFMMSLKEQKQYIFTWENLSFFLRVCAFLYLILEILPYPKKVMRIFFLVFFPMFQSYVFYT